MKLKLVFVIVIGGCIAWVLYSKRRAPTLQSMSPESVEYMGVFDNSKLKDDGVSELNMFFEKYRKLLKKCNKVDFEEMQRHMRSWFDIVMEIYHRLPNDAYVQRDTKVAIQNIEQNLKNHIEIIRSTCSFSSMGIDPTYEFYRSTGMKAFND